MHFKNISITLWISVCFKFGYSQTVLLEFSKNRKFNKVNCITKGKFYYNETQDTVTNCSIQNQYFRNGLGDNFYSVKNYEKYLSDSVYVDCNETILGNEITLECDTINMAEYRKETFKSDLFSRHFIFSKEKTLVKVIDTIFGYNGLSHRICNYEGVTENIYDTSFKESYFQYKRENTKFYSASLIVLDIEKVFYNQEIQKLVFKSYEYKKDTVIHQLRGYILKKTTPEIVTDVFNYEFFYKNGIIFKSVYRLVNNSVITTTYKNFVKDGVLYLIGKRVSAVVNL